MDDIILYIIVKYGRHIISTEEFMHTFEQTHHLNTTVGDHTLSVAAEAVKLCLMRGYSDEETIRNVVTAALCHDLGIMGRKEKYSNTAQCYLKHPLDSVDVYMGVTGEQEERVMDSIRNHMFPVKPGMPRYKEGWILTLADKISSFREKIGKQAVTETVRKEILDRIQKPHANESGDSIIELFTDIPCMENERIVLKQITRDDATQLERLISSKKVYEYEPTFLFEKKYENAQRVIDHLYDEGLRESMILGIYYDGDFCGLSEYYGYRAHIHKISVGYRLLEDYWGRGIATESLGLMLKYLNDRTDVGIVTASTLPENKASANVLKKNGFDLVVSGSQEDWGYKKMLPTDKWIR